MFGVASPPSGVLPFALLLMCLILLLPIPYARALPFVLAALECDLIHVGRVRACEIVSLVFAQEPTAVRALFAQLPLLVCSAVGAFSRPNEPLADVVTVTTHRSHFWFGRAARGRRKTIGSSGRPKVSTQAIANAATSCGTHSRNESHFAQRNDAAWMDFPSAMSAIRLPQGQGFLGCTLSPRIISTCITSAMIDHADADIFLDFE
jgi:hypothetical protein